MPRKVEDPVECPTCGHKTPHFLSGACMRPGCDACPIIGGGPMSFDTAGMAEFEKGTRRKPKRGAPPGNPPS